MFVHWAYTCICQSLTYPSCAATHQFEFEISRCRTSQFSRCFLLAQTHVYNDLSYAVFDTRTLDGLREQSIVGCFPEFVFQFSMAQVLVGLWKQFINNFVFPTWVCAAGFNNYYLMLLWPLRSTFTLFPELQLRGWALLESPAKFFMIGHSWDLFIALSCQSWSNAELSSAHLPNHTLN